MRSTALIHPDVLLESAQFTAVIIGIPKTEETSHLANLWGCSEGAEIFVATSFASLVICIPEACAIAGTDIRIMDPETEMPILLFAGKSGNWG
jgi:hypothetical protein